MGEHRLQYTQRTGPTISRQLLACLVALYVQWRPSPLVGAALCRDGARSGPQILSSAADIPGVAARPIATQGRSYRALGRCIFFDPQVRFRRPAAVA
ncbi:hypothetical protein RK21_03929 [Pseudomonas plecoglossicida]|nr:hypothetical protein RK21_03929 [Pseudomonas plecoglossicida]